MKKYFILEESPTHPGKYAIRLNFNSFDNISTTGSFVLLPARLLHLSYANYLRFCRDQLGGEIVGKKNYYPVVYFSKTENVNTLVEILNARMEEVMRQRDVK